MLLNQNQAQILLNKYSSYTSTTEETQTSTTPPTTQENEDFFEPVYSIKISDYFISPKTIKPGEILKAEIDLLNDGSVDLNDLTVKFEIPTLNLGTSDYINGIWSGDERTLDNFYLRIPLNTQPGDYKFMINIKSSDVDKTAEGTISITSETGTCNGCTIDKLCIPSSSRFSYKNKNSYCSREKGVEIQKEELEQCEEDYECKSNYCSNNKCEPLQEKIDQAVSIEQINKSVEELRKESKDETSFWNKMVEFIKNIFG